MTIFNLKQKINLAKNVVTKSAPIYVQFYITARCNLACEQCNIIYADAKHQEMNIEQINQVAENLKNKYDIIFLLDVLEHIDHDNEFLQSCYFHMKQGAFLIINVPSIPELFSKYDNAVGHIRRYKKRDLKNLLIKSEFKISLLYYWGFLLIPLLFFRKIMMNLSKQNNEEIIKKGMDTQPKTVTFLINMLKYIELKFLRISILGSSLISIVKK